MMNSAARQAAGKQQQPCAQPRTAGHTPYLTVTPFCSPATVASAAFHPAQVITRCISQQVDLLEVLGQQAFSLPQPNDADYEAKATAAVEALLKDMEIAEVGRGGLSSGALFALVLQAAVRCQQRVDTVRVPQMHVPFSTQSWSSSSLAAASAVCSHFTAFPVRQHPHV
jgi:hypothetical protein